MKIKELILFTSELEKQKCFYRDTMGFNVEKDNKNEFIVTIGHSRLIFRESKETHKYHYCFLIPSNKVKESLKWLEERIHPITIEGSRIVEPTTMWNAESIYFYDGVGNIAEFIARFDLDNDADEPFDVNQVLSVNEIGSPSGNVEETNGFLEKHVGSKFWTGNRTRFGTNGNENGIFLLVNNTIKDTWFPTKIFPESAPFIATVEVNGIETSLNFAAGKFTIK